MSAFYDGAAFFTYAVNGDLCAAARAEFVPGGIYCQAFATEVLPLEDAGFKLIYCFCDIYDY